MTIAQSPAFKKAAEEVKNLKATPSQDEMLEVRPHQQPQTPLSVQRMGSLGVWLWKY